MAKHAGFHVPPSFAKPCCVRRRVVFAAMCSLLGAAACGSDSNQSSATTATEATVAAITAAPTTERVTTTIRTETTTTEPAAPTIAAPRTATGNGTFVGIPEALLPGPPAVDGWVTVTGEATRDGDLVGKETYAEAFAPSCRMTGRARSGRGRRLGARIPRSS